MTLEELSFESVNGRTGGRTTNDGQKVITIAHPEQSSGELIKIVGPRAMDIGTVYILNFLTP